MNNQNHTQAFFDSIAIESQALEDTFSQESQNYHNSSNLLGKSWYSIGLESNEADKQKDSANKSGIIRRMIDAIVGFIKRILKKIKDFFIVSEDKQKEWQAQQEFAKNYKGSKAEEKAESKPNEKKGKTPAADEQSASHSNTHADAAQQQRKKWDEKLALVAAMLGKDRLPIIAALFSNKSNLYRDFDNTLKAAVAVLNGMTPDNHDVVGDDLHSLVQSCNAGIAEAAGWSDKYQRDVLNDLVSGENNISFYHVASLFDDKDHNSARLLPIEIADYLAHLEREMEELKKQPSDDESMKKLKGSQKLVSELSAFVSLVAKITSAYSTIVKGLQK